MASLSSGAQQAESAEAHDCDGESSGEQPRGPWWKKGLNIRNPSILRGPTVRSLPNSDKKEIGVSKNSVNAATSSVMVGQVAGMVQASSPQESSNLVTGSIRLARAASGVLLKKTSPEGELRWDSSGSIPLIGKVRTTGESITASTSAASSKTQSSTSELQGGRVTFSGAESSLNESSKQQSNGIKQDAETKNRSTTRTRRTHDAERLATEQKKIEEVADLKVQLEDAKLKMKQLTSLTAQSMMLTEKEAVYEKRIAELKRRSSETEKNLTALLSQTNRKLDAREIEVKALQEGTFKYVSELTSLKKEKEVVTESREEMMAFIRQVKIDSNFPVEGGDDGNAYSPGELQRLTAHLQRLQPLFDKGLCLNAIRKDKEGKEKQLVVVPSQGSSTPAPTTPNLSLGQPNTGFLRRMSLAAASTSSMTSNGLSPLIREADSSSSPSITQRPPSSRLHAGMARKPLEPSLLTKEHRTKSNASARQEASLRSKTGRSSHSRGRKLTCQRCQDRFLTSQLLQLHMRQVHGDLQTRIKRFRKSQGPTSSPRTTTVGGGSPLTSGGGHLTSKSMERIAKLSSTQRRQAHGPILRSGNLVECQCGKVFCARTELTRHLAEIKNGRIYGCPLCATHSSRWNNLKRHQMRTHGQVLETFKCGLCRPEENFRLFRSRKQVLEHCNEAQHQQTIVES